MRLFEPVHNACEFARLLRRLRTGRRDWAIAPHPFRRMCQLPAPRCNARYRYPPQTVTLRSPLKDENIVRVERCGTRPGVSATRLTFLSEQARRSPGPRSRVSRAVVGCRMGRVGARAAGGASGVRRRGLV
jgi:hypothetical protein